MFEIGTMKWLLVLALVTSAVMWMVYWFSLRYEAGNGLGVERESRKKMSNLFLLLIAGFFVKSILAVTMVGYKPGMDVFTSYSDILFKNGISNFYSSSIQPDCSPFYALVLYLTGLFQHLFGIDLGSMTFVYLLKVVPILFDLAAGFLIYKIARKRFLQNSSLLLCAIYIFNPMVIMDSSLWGAQTSMLAFAVLLMCYLFMEENRIAAYFVFVIGILMSHQMIYLTPVLIFAIIDQVFLHECNKKKVINNMIAFVGSIAFMIVVTLPFGITHVVKQYVTSLRANEFASTNAYNFWAFLGRNWGEQSKKILFLNISQWGIIALFVAVLLGAWVYYRHRNDKSKYFLSAATIIMTISLFSVQMNERAIFSAVCLILVAYILQPKKEYFYTYIVLSAAAFLNIAHVLYIYMEYETIGPSGKTIGLVSGTLLMLFGYFIYHIWSPKEHERISLVKTKRGYQKPKIIKEKKEFSITPSKVMTKMTRNDFILLFVILIVYATVAFINLGSFSAPETPQSAETDGAEILLDLGEVKDLNTVWVYLGNYDNRKYQVEVGNDLNQPFKLLGTSNLVSVFNWEEMKKSTTENKDGDEEETDMVYQPCRYVKLTAQDVQSVLMEAVLLDKEGNRLLPVNASEYPNLFDEQDTFEDQNSYMKETYFDEIYHARTAYEMKEGLYNYENTHPPLGKFFISLGVRTFGMNPFGWRCVGTLFGVLMLPFIYLFGKRMFNRTWAATAATLLFAFDFMHFVQTRIATIDVYGTFFIIAMFYFMYRYSQMSFYDTKLSKTMIPLGLGGLCMGLGIASKWTAVYAGAGLGVVFFYLMFIRYREYRLACQKPNEETAGILHADVVANFRKKLVVTLVACVGFFIVVPAIIYLLAYIPFEDGSGKGLIGQLIQNQQTMFSYHSALVAEHPYSSWWYEWPSLMRPVFYYSNTLADGLKQGISTFGNPLVWWAGIPASLYMIYLIFKEKDKTALFLVAAYFFQLGPWMLVTRITFMYHYFPSVPFIVLMIVYCMVRYAKDDKKRIIKVFIYVGFAVALFVVFYPVLSGMIVPDAYIDSLRWMKDWVLA